MELELLKKIGFTDGEIKVYDALLKLGKSSTGEIMKKSNISSSKVYLILDKLIKKGLVSFILEHNIKIFQATNPKLILSYIESKREELEDTKKQIQSVIPKIISHMKKEEEESAQVYKGFKGIAVAYNRILEELHKGEEYCLFTVSQEETQDERVVNFFTQFHKQRIAKGVSIRAIADLAIEKLYLEKNVFGKLYEIKNYPLTLPIGVVIGKNRILFITFGNESVAYEIAAKNMVKRYQEFFNKIWKIAKK